MAGPVVTTTRASRSAVASRIRWSAAGIPGNMQVLRLTRTAGSWESRSWGAGGSMVGPVNRRLAGSGPSLAGSSEGSVAARLRAAESQHPTGSRRRSRPAMPTGPWSQLRRR